MPKKPEARSEVIDQIIQWLDHPETRRTVYADTAGSTDHQLHAGPADGDSSELVREDCISPDSVVRIGLLAKENEALKCEQERIKNAIDQLHKLAFNQ